MEQTLTPHILRAGDGDISPPAGVRDRFMIDGADAGGRFALVQHLFDPRALAAPVHRHHLEDEFTYVLSGRIGLLLGDTEVEALPGDLVFKPRGQWHTFWNAGEEPASVLEIVSPAGLEQLFRALAALEYEPDADELARLAAPYRCDTDHSSTEQLIERHGLRG